MRMQGNTRRRRLRFSWPWKAGVIWAASRQRRQIECRRDHLLCRAQGYIFPWGADRPVSWVKLFSNDRTPCQRIPL